MTDKVVLGIETAIGGGSLAILKGSDVVATSNGVSRAESLVLGIKALATDARITVSDIDLIATSRGPGSFTGIRIGIATTIGLARSLGVKCVGVSLFDAIAGSIPEESLSVIISVGRNQFGIKDFGSPGSCLAAPISLASVDLEPALNQRKSNRIVFCGSEDERLELTKFANVTYVDRDLATLVARRAMCPDFLETLQPIYLGK